LTSGADTTGPAKNWDCERSNPQIGGYYVLYEDGYESFSPADAFESGYSLI
jgi:hypothetical protein